MEGIQAVIILAFLVEAIYTNLRMIWDSNKFNWNQLGALLVAVIVSVFAGVDVFPAVGINMIVPYVGSVLTGILISRGANVIFDVLKKINEMLSGKITTTETVTDGTESTQTTEEAK